MQPSDRIFVAGGTGLVGSAIIRGLHEQGYTAVSASCRNRRPSSALATMAEFFPLDLMNFEATAAYFDTFKPKYVFLAAAKVGGILANNVYRADFIHDNLVIQNNIVKAAHDSGVEKLMFLGSSCIYPKNAPQPMPEDCLLTGPLEYTNEPYAIAKIAGIKLIESFNIQYGTNYIAVMPTNLYGPEDNFDLEKSHVLPAMIRKMHLAKLFMENDMDAIRKDLSTNPVGDVNGSADDAAIIAALAAHGITKTDSDTTLALWGSGMPRREFLHSADMADACIHLMNTVDFSDLSAGMTEVRNTHVNIGTGTDISIRELAEKIARITGYTGIISFDASKPDGTMRKLQDVSKLTGLGWTHRIPLESGIESMYRWYCNTLT